MKNKKVIIISLLVVIVAALLAWFFLKGSFKQEVSMNDPVDVVVDFYNPWLEAVQATSTDPYTEGLVDNPFLSRELKAKILEAKNNPENLIDPVLCQTVVPEKIATRRVYRNDTEAQILVTARKSESTEQALITLLALDGGWYISDIKCTPGEFGPPQGEFTFEKEGFLIKGSIPAPFNPEYWHIVFEENGQQGHVAPIFFKSETVCLDGDGKENACNPDQLSEATKVFVRGDMTEAGVNIKRFEISK